MTPFQAYRLLSGQCRNLIFSKIINEHPVCVLPTVHVVSSLEDPEHAAPPLRGGGLSQCLILFFFPVLVLQEIHDPHSLHPPFTTFLFSLHSPAIQLQAPTSSQPSSPQLEQFLKKKAPLVPQPARAYRT